MWKQQQQHQQLLQLLQQLLVLFMIVPLVQLFIMSSGGGHPSLNGNYIPAGSMWSVMNVLVDENLCPGAANSAINGMSALDFFLLMFPPKQLVAMVDLTNIELTNLEANTTNTSELLKFFGVAVDSHEVL